MSETPQVKKTQKKRAPLSFLNIIGELFLLAGLGILGFIVWQPWYSQIVVGGEAKELASELSDTWSKEPQQDVKVAPGVVPVTKPKAVGEAYSILYIPALGDDFSYQIAEGVGRPVPLDDKKTGVGHYPTTASFGEVGNTAIAAHRNGKLAPFRNIEYLRVGDKIYIESNIGWYTYTFRNSDIVTPTTVDSVASFPYATGMKVTDSLLTLTSCYPKDGAAVRIINYATFDSFRSRADGPPPELVAVNKNVKGNKS